MLTAWFMLLGCLSSVSFGQNYGQTYRGHVSYRRVVSSTVQQNTNPAYQFRSTSPYTSIIGTAVVAPKEDQLYLAQEPYSQARRQRKNWGDPEDDTPGSGQQEVGQVDTPLGEPFVLLLLAGLFVLYKKRRTA